MFILLDNFASNEQKFAQKFIDRWSSEIKKNYTPTCSCNSIPSLLLYTKDIIDDHKRHWEAHLTPTFGQVKCPIFLQLIKGDSPDHHHQPQCIVIEDVWSMRRRRRRRQDVENWAKNGKPDKRIGARLGSWCGVDLVVFECWNLKIFELNWSKKCQ